MSTAIPVTNLRLFKWLIRIQATYILVTAVWPIIDIESFMAITGPKRDVWLVKTVGALLIPVACTMYYHLFIRSDHRPVIVLATLTSLAFVVIDFYYALNDVISNVYLLDGLIELIFLIGWLYLAFSQKNESQNG